MVSKGKAKGLTWGCIEEERQKLIMFRIDTKIYLSGLFPHKFGSGQKYLATTYFGFHAIPQTSS